MSKKTKGGAPPDAASPLTHSPFAALRGALPPTPKVPTTPAVPAPSAAEDAAARGIADGDRVRLFNDISSAELMAKVVPAHRPGQVTVYHAWEPFMAKGRTTYTSVTPNPINPLQLAGGYFHIQARDAEFTPGSTDRATRVGIEKIVPAQRIEAVQLH